MFAKVQSKIIIINQSFLLNSFIIACKWLDLLNLVHTHTRYLHSAAYTYTHTQELKSFFSPIQNICIKETTLFPDKEKCDDDDAATHELHKLEPM